MALPGDSRFFYSKLQVRDVNMTDLLKQAAFENIPPDWFVIIADVKNSTAAVSTGKHNDVNLVAASCLVVALNIASDAGIDIPFFFTGDGGTVLVPPVLLKKILAGLHIHNRNSIRNFSLELHIGSVSIQDILEAGHFLSIARAKAGKITKAVVLGDGLQYAEQLIKNAQPHDDNADEALLNMQGLECRWDKVKPPAQLNEVVCYLVVATSPQEQAQVYADVLQKMDEIFGTIEVRNPLSLDRLKLLMTLNKVKKEMMARFGRWRPAYLISTLATTFVGSLFFRFNWKVNKLRGKEYLQQVISNADILTIDGRINCIVSSSSDRRKRFIAYLDKQEQAGNLLFGHFVNTESIMTCYIESRNDKHIHFVDGADGGYTEAAKELKVKLAKVK